MQTSTHIFPRKQHSVQLIAASSFPISVSAFFHFSKIFIYLFIFKRESTFACPVNTNHLFDNSLAIKKNNQYFLRAKISTQKWFARQRLNQTKQMFAATAHPATQSVNNRQSDTRSSASSGNSFSVSLNCGQLWVDPHKRTVGRSRWKDCG